MFELETIWAGERGAYLCADGPSTSFAQRCVMDGESDDEAPRQGRGYRPVGARFRDTVFGALVPGGAHVTLAQACARMEASSQAELEQIARALKALVDESRVHRALVKLGPGRPKWVYWRT